MNTLYAQRVRLSEELRTAEQDLKAIMQSDNPNPSILNFYEDLINRHRMLVRMIDEHLEEGSAERKSRAQ